MTASTSTAEANLAARAGELASVGRATLRTRSADPEHLAADGGIGIVTGLTGDTAGLPAWLSAFQHRTDHYGVFGNGLAGFVTGLDCAAQVEPRLSRLAVQTRSRLLDWTDTLPWRSVAVDWDDYDLIYGPAGIALTLADGATESDRLRPVAEHLRALTGPGLAGLTVGRHHPGEPRDLNVGRINTGLGHGVPGVVAALNALIRAGVALPGLTESLDNCVQFLIRTRYLDERGAPSWRPMHGDADPAPTPAREQVWCYGTPGVSWTLWDAATELGDAGAATSALDSFDQLAEVWDDEAYLLERHPGSRLCVCHGAAGVLLVADAFVRYAGSAAATRLRNRLIDFLLDRLDELPPLASIDGTLLTGSAGVLAALLTVSGGTRDWLRPLGLR